MVPYFYRTDGNNFQNNQPKTSPSPPKQSRLPLIIGVVVGVVVVLCVAIVCIVIVCRRRRRRRKLAIPTSHNEAAVQNKEIPSQNHANQAYQPHGLATSKTEPYPNGQNQENSFSFFIGFL